MTTREDDLLERIRQRRKLSEDLDLDSLISARRKALEAGEEPEVETVTTVEEEGPGIIERISERVRRVLPGGGPEAPERDPGALGEAVSSTVERGQRLAEATGFPMPDAPRRVPRQRLQPADPAARDATRRARITEEPDQAPTREELLARSDVTDTGAREAGRRARRLRNPEIVPLPDDVEDAETPEDVAFGLERLLEDETREDLEDLKRRGGRGLRRLGETSELRRPTEAGETRFRMEEGVQGQRERLQEIAERERRLDPALNVLARGARGIEKSPLLGQFLLRPLRSLYRKHVVDGDMSAEEFMDSVEASGLERAAEVLGELTGYGLEIGATARGLGAAGEALPSGSRTGRFLRAFNPSRPTTRARAAATGAAEGLPSDIAAAVQHDDPSLIPLGMGLGAAAGAALRPRLKGGRARGADDLVDDVGGAERRTRADEVPRPDIEGRARDAVDEASATERVPIREEAAPVEAEGQGTVIKSADGTETRASYAIVDASEAPPSHNPVTFDRNPDFPEGIQERRYHADPVAQEEVVERARELDPSILLDPTQRPTDGPAIIRPDGVRLSGNQRGMLLMRAKELHPERFDDYVDELVQRAEEFGVQPQQAERSVRDVLDRGGTPELVRMTEATPTSRGELAELMSKFNDVATKAKDPLAEAATRARRLREAGGALRTFRENISEEETLRSFLGTASGREFVQDLVAEGVIPRQEASRFINRRTGAVNAEGKTLVERMMQSAAVGDPEVIDRAPPSWLRKIEKAIPALIQSSQFERWDLGPVLREALDLGAAVRASGAARTVDDLISQTDLTGRQFSPEAAQLARFMENNTPNDVSAALREYAEQARSAVKARQSEDLFGFEPPTPGEAREGVFGAGRPAALDPDNAPQEAFTDLFGEPVAREGPAQGSLLPEGGGPQGMSEAVEEARSIVSRLEGKVRRGAASDAEVQRYNEARSLLRRGEGLDADEVAARSREAEPTLQADDTRDLFELRPDEPRPLPPRDQRPRATETPPPEPSPLSDGFDATGVRQARRRGQPGPQASAQLRDIGEFSMEPGSGVAPDPTKIARDLAEAVDVKLAEGQLTGKVRSALGIFKPRSEVVRVQDVSDIRTLGHEVGHSLQKVFFGSQGGRLNDAPLRELSEPIQQELRQLGSGVSDESLAEGWAEYWRRYVDNPSVLGDRAPRLHQYVQRGLDEHPEIRTALQKTRDQWRLHREAGPEARIASKISDQDEPRHFDVSDAWDRFRTNVFDDFHPIKRVVDFLEEKGVGPTSISENAEQLARLVRGSTGQGDHFLEKGTLDFATLETRGKPLKEIVEPVKGRLDRFKRYIVARRAVELHERGINPGFREEDVRAFVRRMDDVHGEDFQQAFDELQTYQTQLLEYLRDAGVISDESLDAILEVNRNYVPFYRALEGKEFLGGLSERFGHLFSPVKRIKGSGEKVIDPLESITKNTYLYTHLAAKQQVSQALGRLAMKEGAGQMLEGIMRPVEPIKFTLDEIRSQLDEMLGGEVVGEIVETMAERGGREDPLEELLMVFRPGDYFDRPNTISVLQGGKRQWFEVDPDLYEALEGLHRDHLDGFARFLGVPSRTLRAGAVLAPEFQLRNPARDQLMAFVQSEYGYKPGIDMARGMFELLRKGDAYWQWKAAGGERAALLGLDRKAMREKVEELIQSGGVPNVIKDPLDGLRALSAVMEDATRVGEFLRAREQLGTSKEALQTAAGAAREVSTDFARHGAKTAFVRHTTAFWNARLQGYDRLARAINKNPGQALGRAFASITLPSILEYQMNRNNPEYWEIPQWQRDLFWLVEIGDTWIRVPKPFELGVVFGTLPQRILQSIDEQAPNELDSFFAEWSTSEMESLFPIPTGAMPIFENFANRSLFLDRPIVPLSQQRLSAERQFGPYTSEVAKMIGRWAPGEGVSPRKIDNLLYGFTAGLGRHAMSAVDRGVAAVRGDPPEPSGTLADVPGLRGVIARDPGFSSTSVEKFYRLYARANRAVADHRDLESRGSREELREQDRDPQKRRLRALAPRLRRVAGELSDHRDERDRIRQDPNMDPDEKRERMEDLGRRAMIAARRAIQRLPEGIRE